MPAGLEVPLDEPGILGPLDDRQTERLRAAVARSLRCSRARRDVTFRVPGRRELWRAAVANLSGGCARLTDLSATLPSSVNRITWPGSELRVDLKRGGTVRLFFTRPELVVEGTRAYVEHVRAIAGDDIAVTTTGRD